MILVIWEAVVVQVLAYEALQSSLSLSLFGFLLNLFLAFFTHGSPHINGHF